ncbi:hypothetical protein B0T18DRAFT_446779 [Schizothecium vesticola]|uniref:Uncharacterized protein n=1 Tax=Schizothecium vesticola TaxID=314040 RepID=A0AA40EVB5_9PEZI|nr:hypothetical protein B0T18DRAFT_446779 [Schizothecium vesticola]
MQRQAARAALGRRALALDSACAATTTTTTTTPALYGRQPFSTTTAVQGDGNEFSRGPPPSSRQRSQQAAERLGQLSQSSSFTRPTGFVDARSFRKPEGGATGDSSRIISIQSLRGRGGLDGGRRGAKKVANEVPKAVVYSEAEKAVMDRSEQGIVRDYVPTVQMKDLSGYGAPVATDTTLGQVETALRTMRIMGGGNAFNSDAGVTVDARAVRRRYLKEKKPVFFNTLEEKDWAERASPGLKVTMPEVATRKAIVDLTIRGQYEAPAYVEVTDAMGTITNYHNSTFSYTGAHSRAFIEKVQSLLPVDTTARPADEQKKLP